jgi:hypothetical protein
MKIQCIMIFLASGIACWGQSNRATVPGDMTTIQGRVYHNAAVLRADPDGLLISYQPQTQGMGLAKVRYQVLPDSIRTEYKYNAQDAANFEQAQAKAAEQWRSDQLATSPLQQFRAAADLARFLGGTDYSTFWVNLGSDGRVTAQGFSGSVPPYVWQYSPGVGVEGSLDPGVTSNNQQMPASRQSQY